MSILSVLYAWEVCKATVKAPILQLEYLITSSSYNLAQCNYCCTC